MKPHPTNPTIFVTGGKENIRFWKVKSKLITGQSVVLNANGRDKVFTDIAFQTENDDEDQPIRT
jgi:hypothetical protein